MSMHENNSTPAPDSASSGHYSESDPSASAIPSKPRKGPLSFLSGSVTSLVLAWLSFGLSKKVVVYLATHSSNFSNSTAQNIASAMKTLFIGMCFLATFSFAFIGLGLLLVFLRSLFTKDSAEAS